MDINIISKRFAKNKTEACFYFGDQIATRVLENRKFSIESRGSLEVILNDEKFKGDMARKELHSLGYTNKKFHKLEDNIIFSNWFALIEINSEGDCISDDLEICFDYDEALLILEKLEEYIN